MAKQLNVELGVRADTKQAQEALQALGKSLQDIQNIKNMPMVADESYKSAARAAKELERNLQSAVNVDTGKLDLNKFSMSLKRSNTSITELAVKLNGAGATGQQAFLNLAKSIALADNSALNLGTKLGGLMTTLKNTVRWQFSSSILHGFMGAIQGAYGYAQDLNESLNNIRIVTGQSIDQMAKFADEANRAARALSTTTTEYTNASLIYYQQGLSDAEVKARTDVTIKLANVSRQSAEEVSSQMTAIWNNFDDGTKSLEYYADVITALGAATASSSSEIAEGLQKFAAIAETVGLGYEKASAALATVVAETRQSADVVGTAFKTMFARFQGLSLGETLEDGVDLNKYSKALKTVGVNILDANGQLKEMDTILDETYVRWNQISEAQRVALAETVAGTRQYAQFMAIMNNYDKILANQSLAEGSEGTVQKQADIYAEGWEAARDRVRAALEDVYSQLLDDKFFIGILNFAEKAVSAISNVIEGLGGIKGLVMLIGSIFMNTYAKEMPRVLETISQNLLIISGRGEQVKSNMLAEIQAGLDLNKSSAIGIGQQTQGKEMAAQYQATEKAVEMTRKLNAAMKTLSQTEIEEYQAKIQQTVKDGEYIASLGKEIDLLTKKNEELTKATAGSAKATLTGASAATWSAMEKYDAKNQGKLTEDNFSTSQNMADAITAAENEKVRAQDTYIEAKAKLIALQQEEIQNDEAIKKATEDKNAAERLLEEASLRVKALKESQAGLEEKLNGSFKTTAGSAITLNSEVENIKLRTERWLQTQASISKLLAGNAAQQEKGKRLAGEMADQMQKYGDYVKKAAQDAADAVPEDQRDTFNALVQEASKFQEVVARATETGDWSEVTTMLEKDGELFDHLSTAAGEAAESLSEAKAHLRVDEGMDAEQVDKLATSLGEADAKQRIYNQGLDEFGQKTEEGLTHTAAFSEGLTQIGATAMQVSMAINGIKRLGSIWDDDSLSAGEKILQTMTSLSTILPLITTLTNAQKLADLSGAAARALGITGIWTETKAHWLSVPAKNAAGASGYVALGPLLLFVAIAAGAILLIYGLVKGIKALVDAYNADAIAAEKAAKTAQELADAAKTANDRLKDIQDTISGYKSAVEKLEQCTKGTKEWNEALTEVHAQIESLLEKYPELLSEADLFNKDGTLNIDVLDRFEQQASTVATTAQAAALQGSVASSQARLKSNTTDASRKYEYYDEYGAYNFGHKDGTFSTVQSDLTKLLNSYQATGSQALELADTYGALGDITDEYAKTLFNLAQSSIAATNTMNNAAKMAIDTWAADTDRTLAAGQDVLMTAAYNEAVSTFSEAVKEASDSNAKSDKKDTSKLGSAFDDTSFAGMSVTEAFNKARGTNNALARNGVRGTDNNRTYVYLENGEEKEYKIEEMQATIAAAAALEQMGAAADKAAEQLASMDESTKEFIASGSLEGLNQSEFAAYREKLNLAEGQQVTADEAKQLLIDQGIDEAIAEQLKQSFANNLNIDWGSLTDSLDSLGISEILGEKVTEGLTLGNAEGLVKTIERINLGPAGEDIGKKFVEKINDEMLTGLSAEDQQDALNQLLNIDWSKWDALDEADQIMKEFNVDIDTGAQEWVEFANEMRIATGAMPDYSALKTTLADVYKIVQDLDFGKTISDDDYQKLVAYNQEWEKFFLLQADGTRKFVGDSKDLQEATLENLKAQRADLSNRAKAQEALENDKWGFGEGNLRESIDWTDVKSSSKNNKIGTLTNMMNDSSGAEGVLEILGYDDATLQKYLNDTDLYAEEIDEVFKRIADFMSQDYAAEDNSLDEMFASAATSYDELTQLLDEGLTSQEAAAKQMEFLATSAINAATSLDELDVAIVKAQQAGVTVDYDKYANQLVNLASQYDNTAFEVARYQEALERAKEEGGEQSQAALKEAEANLRAATAAGEAAKKYGLTAGQIERYAEELKNSGDYSKATKRELVELAKDQLRYDKAVVSAQKNMSKWTKDLKVAKDAGHLVAETADEMAAAYGDLLDIDGSELSAEFLSNADNLDLMKKALEGDEEAYRALQDAVREDIETRFGINDEEFQTKYADIIGTIDEFNNTELGKLEAGASIDNQDYLDALTEMVNAAGMTAQEATDYLSSMGIDAEVVNEPETHKETVGYDMVPTVGTEPVAYSPPGGEATATYPKVTYEAKPVEIEKTTNSSALKVTSAAKSSGGKIKHSGSTAANGGSNNGGGGGGGGSKKQNAKEYKNVTDETERYHVLNEQLDDLSAAYDRASNAKDRLFGANKLKAINEEIKALDKLIKHNDAYLDAIKTNIKIDQKALVNGGLTKQWVDSDGNLQNFTSKGLDIDFQFDENGVLLNYDQYIATAVNAYNQAVDAYNSIARQEGVTEEQIKVAEDAFKQAELQYELSMQALSQYEETVNLWEEKLEEKRDYLRQEQDKRFEEWSYKLELKIKITDEDKRYLEYFRKHLDRFAKNAFAPVTELLTIWNNVGTDSDWKVLQQGSADLKDAFESLKSATHGDPIIDSATGKLLQDFDYSQADWMDALNDVQDKIYAQIDALYELDETMSNYYSETLSEAETKLDQYMTKLEDCTNVLKHFQTVSELLGKETDYKWMGTILTAQRSTIQNELESATTEYNYAKEQYETMLARYERDKNNVDEGTRELMEQELQAQYESMTKWQETMLTKTEEFAEACIAVYENMVHQQGKVLEDALTNGRGWDSMLASMDRVSAYQDLILTRTNQLYETNKLMRKLSQDIDRTDSIAAKTKLANFKREIEDMQNMNEMSKFDLDVANARYELLLAQIALEEAQNAKSTVRLQRDSEGNYGYVYTADQDKINDAEQALEDKQNDLYNLTLNKANENARALAELDKEMYDELERIAIEYRGNEQKILEEAERVRLEYAQRRSILERDYTEADYWQHQVSATRTNEAWANAYKVNLVDTENWQIQVSGFIKDIQNAHRELTNDMETYVAPTVGDNLTELKRKTDELKASSEKYQKWFDTFANTNQHRLDEIAKITNEYFKQRDAIGEVIDNLRIMADEINNIRANEAGMNRSIDGYVEYDPNVDYSDLMQQHLANGGSQNDETYRQLARQREAKINGLQMDSSVYGYRGTEFDNVLSYYQANNLSGYITPAVSQYAAAHGDDLGEIITGNTQAQKEYIQKMTESAEVVQDAAKEVSQGVSESAEKTIAAATENAEKTAEDLANANAEFKSSTEDATGSIENSAQELESGLDKTNYTLSDVAREISEAVSAAASRIESAVANIHVDVTVSTVGMASGGYTGSWGNSGKLALLHEKELVLNAEDTANMLAAVDMVRQLNSAIDLRVAASGVSTSLYSPGYQGVDQTLEQTVTITAEFPNATNHTEIEEAFDNLMNRATQYASRPRQTSYGINSVNV